MFKDSARIKEKRNPLRGQRQVPVQSICASIHSLWWIAARNAKDRVHFSFSFFFYLATTNHFVLRTVLVASKKERKENGRVSSHFVAAKRWTKSIHCVNHKMALRANSHTRNLMAPAFFFVSSDHPLILKYKIEGTSGWSEKHKKECGRRQKFLVS